MSTPNPAEVIAEALAAHAFPTFNIERGCWDCPCGEPVPRSANGWEKHVASVIAALPDIAIIESQPEPPDPAVLGVVSDFECDEWGEDLQFGRTHDGRWKGYVNGGKAYFSWPELVRRYGPLRVAGGES